MPVASARSPSCSSTARFDQNPRRDGRNRAEGEEGSDVGDDLGYGRGRSRGASVPLLGGSDRSGLVCADKAGTRPPFEHSVKVAHAPPTNAAEILEEPEPPEEGP
jgi:hypothetical protein